MLSVLELCIPARCIRNAPLCVDAKTENKTEAHHAFCLVHRYRRAAAGFRVGGKRRWSHEPVAYAGRRREGGPAGCGRALDHDRPRGLYEWVRYPRPSARSVRQRLPPGHLSSKRRAALLRGKVGVTELILGSSP